MIVRKLKDTEAEQVKDLFLYCIDQIKDLETVSLSKFREISNNNDSIIDYLIQTLNNEDNNYLKEKIEEYEKYYEWV